MSHGLLSMVIGAVSVVTWCNPPYRSLWAYCLRLFLPLRKYFFTTEECIIGLFAMIISQLKPQHPSIPPVMLVENPILDTV